jgi:hypothetical protein
MSAIPYDKPEQSRDTPESEPLMTPGRPRRRFLNRKSAALAAAATCAAGFYTGVRVEKSQVTNSTSSATTAATGAATARTGAGGFPGAGGFGAAGGAGGDASAGTIASVDGTTIYLTESSGNTIKVKLASTTKLTKSQSVSKSSLDPGDTVVIQGVKGANGTVTATSISDSGVRTTGGSTSAGGSTGTS